MTDITIQAATDAALASLLIQHGLLTPTEGGVQAAPGVLYSHIGAASADGVQLEGRYAFLGLDDETLGEARVASLLLALAPHRYTGPDLRVRFGGSNYRDDGVPFAVTMRQARLALLRAGKLSRVQTAIDGIKDPTEREAARITWEYSTEVQRRNGLIDVLAPALGMTSDDIDALFIAAKGL